MTKGQGAGSTVTRRVSALAGIIIGVSLIWQAFFTDHHHAHYWYHFIPGFDALFGLAGTIVLIWTAKTLGELVLQRRESYYMSLEREPGGAKGEPGGKKGEPGGVNGERYGEGGEPGWESGEPG